MNTAATLAELAAPAATAGLALRGAFHPGPEDGVPPLPNGATCGTLVLLGFGGGVGWSGFAASGEAADGGPDPLDRWSRRVIGTLAQALGGMALYPFGGPPWLPFQRWARLAEPAHPSPLGLLIHPAWGLWHSYRGAIALPAQLALPARQDLPSPCDRCLDRLCLAACPVGAFAPAAYDVARCAAHLAAPEGADCRHAGCAARRACPVGASWRHGPDQARFHMAAFAASVLRTRASTPSQSPGAD